MSKRLLREFRTFSNNNSLLNDEERREKEEHGKVFLAGVCQRAGAKNQNGRVYPRQVLEREVENYQKLVRERRALGELDHAENEIVNLQNASHLIRRLWWEGNDLYCVLELLDTTQGKNAKALVESGVTLGISSRALGSTRDTSQGKMVGEDLQLVCWDLVSNPSTDEAYQYLQENKINNPKPNLFDKSYRINRKLNSILE